MAKRTQLGKDNYLQAFQKRKRHLKRYRLMGAMMFCFMCGVIMAALFFAF